MKDQFLAEKKAIEYLESNPDGDKISFADGFRYAEKLITEQSKAENLPISGVVLSCPCHHLDKPCKPNCTCKNPFSSAGCNYCCTYGSKDQQKSMAEYLTKNIKT